MKKCFISVTLCFGLLVAAGCNAKSPSVSPLNESQEKVESSVPKQAAESNSADNSTPVSVGMEQQAGNQQERKETTSFSDASQENKNKTSEPAKEETLPKITANAQSRPSSQPSLPKDEQTGNATADVEQVKAKYNDQLVQAKQYYIAQLQSLYNQAVAAKKNGKSNQDIYNAFSQQAGSLQEDSQAKVNQILMQMKNELAKQNLPADSVNELRSAFYSELDKAKEDITKKAKNQLG